MRTFLLVVLFVSFSSSVSDPPVVGHTVAMSGLSSVTDRKQFYGFHSLKMIFAVSGAASPLTAFNNCEFVACVCNYESRGA